MRIKNIDSFKSGTLNEGLEKYLNSLEYKYNKYHYFPCKNGLTKAGQEMSLGFSCYALKIYYTLNKWKNINENDKQEWGNFINSFQKNEDGLPRNSFIDEAYIKNYNKFTFNAVAKDFVKKTLNLSSKYNYQLKQNELVNSVRAESKQAIATLNQVKNKNKLPYEEFPKTELEINKFLDSFDWSKPWSAGAQFSGLCVFSATQMKDMENIKNHLGRYIDSKANGDGFYYIGSKPNFTELVNGSMKVLTGLDWLGLPIHYPEKLIDMCLANKPSEAGCDLVDYVYVLYRCSLQTEYKKREIVSYLENFYELIFKHYHSDDGGFSYGINQSQMLYYGVTISQGLNESDIHGTVLLTWALSMIFKLTENQEYDWNVLKP